MTLSVRVICSFIVGIKACLDSDKIIKNRHINLLTSHKTNQSKIAQSVERLPDLTL